MADSPKISGSDAELWRKVWSMWLRTELLRFFGRDGPMRIVGATWTPQVNTLLIRCGCGEEFQHRADRWTVRCNECFAEENLSEVRERYRIERETEMAKQNQQTGLAPSVFQKYMGPMKGAWDQGKSKAKEGTKALGTGEFFCRLTKLYFKEVEPTINGKKGPKCLGAAAKLTVVLGDNSGSTCWVDWRFYTDDKQTAEDRWQFFQKDLVKLGMEHIETVEQEQLPAEMERLAKATPGVKIRRYNDPNGNKDANGNVYIRTFLVGYVDEESLVGMGAVPKRGNGGNTGGAAIEEPSEPTGDFQEPPDIQEPEQQQAPAPAQRRTRKAAEAPAAAAQPAAAPQAARPPRGQPTPVELDDDNGGDNGELDLGGEPGMEGEEPPMEGEEQEPVIEVGTTVQFNHPKTGKPMLGTVKARHSSNTGWLIKDNNSTEMFGIKDDNPSLKIAD